MTRTLAQSPQDLAASIRSWGRELGFEQVGFADIDLQQAEQRLQDWLAQGFHGDMHYMHKHGVKRSRPAELVPETVSVISVSMNYLPSPHDQLAAVLENPALGYIARYALGRDYHKTMRNRLQKLATRIQEAVGPFGYRAFVDSAPVLEKPLAEKAGIGWLGKHTNIINKDSGSWFLLGEIYTDLPLPTDEAAQDHCGSCRACLDVCPTRAIVAPYQLDARKCISYLTIEQSGPIPIEYRKAIGNRIFGCDDCQLFCPWNKFAQLTSEQDFAPRHELDRTALAELFLWQQAEWEERTAGSAIRRAGYTGWLRNIAIALGNAPTTAAVIDALKARQRDASEMVREHVGWALEQHGIAADNDGADSN